MSKLDMMRGCALLLVAQAACAQAVGDEGLKLFTQVATPACALCHTLESAGAQGAIGPNLDELKPDAARVEKAVRNGIGQMPAFKDLSDEQISTLGKYVEAAARGGK
jgi:cytochrome c6